jgi:hypothetical protein
MEKAISKKRSSILHVFPFIFFGLSIALPILYTVFCFIIVLFINKIDTTAQPTFSFNIWLSPMIIFGVFLFSFLNIFFNLIGVFFACIGLIKKRKKVPNIISLILNFLIFTITLALFSFIIYPYRSFLTMF